MQAHPARPLTQVATYERQVAASSERVWENVHDWEHLPWLHDGSFSSIECLESGPWGWRARVGLSPASTSSDAAAGEILLELVLDGPDRYVSRVLEGAGAASEIWTTVSELDETHTGIRVEFWLPDVDPAHADALGQAYAQLYTRLWDEDESMMVRRTDELASRSRRGKRRVALGPLAELRPRLPLLVEIAGRSYRLLELEGELVAHSARCPHLLGPLGDGAVEEGVVTCPWHGYRFDVRSGRSCDDRGLRLDRAPRIEVATDSSVTLSL